MSLYLLVTRWFSLLTMCLSRAHIQARAVHEAKLHWILNFKASDGWFRNWRNRFSIGASLLLFGEALM